MTILIRKEMRFCCLALLIFYAKERRRCSTHLLQRLGSVVYSRYNISRLRSDSEFLIVSRSLSLLCKLLCLSRIWLHLQVLLASSGARGWSALGEVHL